MNDEHIVCPSFEVNAVDSLWTMIGIELVCFITRPVHMCARCSTWLYSLCSLLTVNCDRNRIRLLHYKSSSQVCQSLEVNAADSMWTVIGIESFSFINTYETNICHLAGHFLRRQQCTVVNSKHPPSLWTVTRMSWPRLELGEVGYFIDTPDEPTSLACASTNGRVTRSPWTVATFAEQSRYTTVTHGSSRPQLWVRTSDELL